MANKIALTQLNASTVDILNTIRANASYQYQNLIPEITEANEIPKIGEIIYGYPAMANEFINSLVNRIALVLVRSMVFNNPFADLKKGMLSYGETIEEAFVSMTKARKYDPDKAPSREFKRTLPDVRTAFHTINWKVMYPITIQHQELQRAFLSENGVRELIDKILNAVYNANFYDEYELMKYQLIKAISHGKMKPIAIDDTDMNNAGVAFRGIANKLPFPSVEYNEAHVLNNTNKSDLHIFMSAEYNAKYDIEVLARAFNMDRADLMGRIHVIDDWTTFDNDRFSEIRAESDGLEEVTAEELELMKDVKAVMIDKEWFQHYDNLMEFTEVQVTTGLYWNYNLHVWKTISHSPFSNAIVFVADDASTEAPDTLTFEIVSKETYEGGTILTLEQDDDDAQLPNITGSFVQTEADVVAGLAVLKQGGFIIPSAVTTLSPNHVKFDLAGTGYTINSTVSVADCAVGDTITLEKDN